MCTTFHLLVVFWPGRLWQEFKMVLDSPEATEQEGKYILCNIVVLSGLLWTLFLPVSGLFVDYSSGRIANICCSLELIVMTFLILHNSNSSSEIPGYLQPSIHYWTTKIRFILVLSKLPAQNNVFKKKFSIQNSKEENWNTTKI